MPELSSDAKHAYETLRTLIDDAAECSLIDFLERQDEAVREALGEQLLRDDLSSGKFPSSPQIALVLLACCPAGELQLLLTHLRSQLEPAAMVVLCRRAPFVSASRFPPRDLLKELHDGATTVQVEPRASSGMTSLFGSWVHPEVYEAAGWTLAYFGAGIDEKELERLGHYVDFHFIAALASTRPDLVADAIRGMSEERRAELLPDAMRAWHEATTFDYALGGSAVLKPKFFYYTQTQAILTALVGLAPSPPTKDQLNRHHVWAAEPVVNILIDRRPPWIQKFSNAIEVRWPELAYQLFRAGLAARPSSEAWLVVYSHHRLFDQIRNDPGFLNKTFLPMMAIEECIGEIGFAGRNHTTELTSALLDRGMTRRELLDLYLHSLSSDFRASTVAWIPIAHDFLKPTVDELAEKSDTYVHLVSANVSTTVTHALKAVSVLQKHDRLTADQLTLAATAAFQAGGKAQATAGVGIVEKGYKSGFLSADAAAVVLLEGIGHPNPSIQESAGRCLTTLLKDCSPATCREVFDRCTEGSSTATHQLLAALRELGDGDSAVDSHIAPNNSSNISSGADSGVAPNQATELTIEASGLTPDEARAIGLDTFLAAINANELPPPRIFDHAEVVRRHRDPEPFGSDSELLDACLSYLSGHGGIAEFERIATAVARRADQPLASAELRKVVATAVKKSARAIEKDDRPNLGVALAAWLEIDVPSDRVKLSEEGDSWSPTPRRFLWDVLRDLATRLGERKPFVPLFVATHPSGWVGPSILVRRIAENLDIGAPISDMDLVAAFTRLDPRAEAGTLEEAQRLQTRLDRNVAAYLSVALGGPITTPVDRIPIYVWIARFHDLKLGGSGPLGSLFDGLDDLPIRNPKITEFLEARLNYWGWTSRGQFNDSPGAMAYVNVAMWGWRPTTSASSLDWLICPGLADQFVESWAFNYPEVDFRRVHTNLIPLVDPDQPLGQSAMRSLAMALSCEDANARSAGAEILVRSADDGRLDALAIGRILAELSADNTAVATRLAPTIATVSAVSTAHAAQMLLLTTGFLETPPKTHSGLVALLERMREAASASAYGVLSGAARSTLATAVGKGRASKLAQEILTFAAHQPCRALVLQQWNARIDTARRWFKPVAGNAKSRFENRL